MNPDYWIYQIGVNVIAVDTLKKIPIEERSEYQKKSLAPELYEQNKRNGLYDKGIAIVPGKVLRGPQKEKYLVFVDLDHTRQLMKFVTTLGLKTWKNYLRKYDQTTK